MDPYLRDVLDVLLRMLHVTAGIAWIGASFYFVRLDLALRPPKSANGRGRGCRRRVLGSARRRPLPLAEVPPRARRDARAAALVQVGGVHDLALRLRAHGRPLLLRRRRAAGRSDGRRPFGLVCHRALDRRARARLARLRRALPNRGAAESARPGDRRASRSSRLRPGARASSSPHEPRISRSGRCSGRSWPRTSSS